MACFIAKYFYLLYVHGHRRCSLNIPKTAIESSKLKQEFIDETKEVDEIRQYLVQNKVIALAELTQLNINIVNYVFWNIRVIKHLLRLIQTPFRFLKALVLSLIQLTLKR